MNLFDFLLDARDSLINYFQTPDFQKFVLWAKLFSFGISSFLIFAILILLSRSRATWWIKERIDAFGKVNLPERLERYWQKIQARLEKTDEASLKLAVIEADNFFGDILKRMGLAGKDMGERLEQISREQLKSIDEVWDAHRLRNLIVHESDVHINREQAEKAVNAYKNALKELEVF